MWPDGKRFAVTYSFDFDAEEMYLSYDESYRHRPVGLSAGRYDVTVGVPETLNLLERRGVRATFFVPGRVAEAHPDSVRDIVSAGHELGCHGYEHVAPFRMSAEEEERDFDRAREALEPFGTPVVG